MTVQIALQVQNIVGESVLWDNVHNRVLWVDIVGKTIHAFYPETGGHRQWPTPDFVTSIGLRRDGGAIVAFTKSICLWDYEDQFRPFAQIELDIPDNRLNEGVIGPDGAFWVGTMQNNIDPAGNPTDITEATGQLFRITSDGQVQRVSDDLFGITNTLIWAQNGRLITADTLKNEIYSYTIDPDTKQLTDRKVIIFGFDRGLPDGSTIDAEGYIWNCRVVGGSCLVRFSPDGQIDRIVELPCSWPTSCAFGGENLTTLFVTSARFTMDETHLKTTPQEGALFAINVGVKGQLCNRFEY
ncbi:MAG: SMP-30/gluconolactonase/LRE family protein [Roseovarius sp.]|nr:SMP-30/gluconolactonase/LRE family protein [Roseovarius sp.]